MGTGPNKLPAKKDVAWGLLLRGSIFVHLDPRVDGVMVPRWLAKQPQLVLQIGLDMPVPITDLRVDDEGVFGTLSFNRSPFSCVVPWEAVFALADEHGRAMVWPESMPEELRAEVERELGVRPPVGLRAVPSADDGDADDDDEVWAPADEPSRDPAPRLRAISASPSSETLDADPEPTTEERDSSVSTTSSGRPLPPYLRVVK